MAAASESVEPDAKKQKASSGFVLPDLTPTALVNPADFVLKLLFFKQSCSKRIFKKSPDGTKIIPM